MIPAEDSKSWGDFKSSEEANADFRQLPEDTGYVLRIDHVSDPEKSPFVDVDQNGNTKPPAWQTKITFTVVEYANDDEDPKLTVIGQQIKQFFRISMHTKSNFYAMAKSVFGGSIDPTWKPNAAELYGKVVGAMIAHKEPNDKGYIYPKISAFVPYRGKKSFKDVVAIERTDNTEPSDVPF